MVSVNPPSGFRDFLNEEAQRRLELMHTISKVYQSFGFLPLETPVLENLELLVGRGGGDENEKLIFKVLKRGEKFVSALAGALPAGDSTRLADGGLENQIAEFGMRFDLTLPLSRVVAAHRGKIPLPWKVFHTGPVWRAERAQKGRYREFVQCDVDLIGAKGIGAEIEVLQAGVTAVSKTGASGFELRINDRRLLLAMARRFGFAEGKEEKFAIVLDKQDKVSPDELKLQLRDLLGRSLSVELESLIDGGLKNPMDLARQLEPEATHQLEFLIATLTQLELPLERITFDPTLVRGMGYYTGPVFELRHASAGYSFGGGGRYNQLIGKLCGQDIPAVGFSLGFERIALLLAEQQKLTRPKSQVLFIPVMEESLRATLLVKASEIRKRGFLVDVYPDAAKVKNQFKFASDRGVQWVLIWGKEELDQGKVKLKNFESGEEQELPSEALFAKLDQLKG